ncbi:hypothetical protein [Photorhabdus luminescens]|nr:hypothetical protein [Photorhabdus luminescens]
MLKNKYAAVQAEQRSWLVRLHAYLLTDPINPISTLMMLFNDSIAFVV